MTNKRLSIRKKNQPQKPTEARNLSQKINADDDQIVNKRGIDPTQP